MANTTTTEIISADTLTRIIDLLNTGDHAAAVKLAQQVAGDLADTLVELAAAQVARYTVLDEPTPRCGGTFDTLAEALSYAELASWDRGTLTVYPGRVRDHRPGLIVSAVYDYGTRIR